MALQQSWGVSAQQIRLRSKSSRRIVSYMASRAFPVDSLSAEERIALMGQLWDSLDPAIAAPVSGELAAELGRREAEADAAPDSGESWSDIHSALLRKLR